MRTYKLNRTSTNYTFLIYYLKPCSMVSKWLFHVCRKENGQRNQNTKGDEHANTCIAIQNGKAIQWGVKCIHTVRAQMNLYIYLNSKHVYNMYKMYRASIYTNTFTHSTHT